MIPHCTALYLTTLYCTALCRAAPYLSELRVLRLLLLSESQGPSSFLNLHVKRGLGVGRDGEREGLRESEATEEKNGKKKRKGREGKGTMCGCECE
jgi:hypothetical protein